MSGAVSGPEVLLILQPLALPLQVVVEGLPLLRALSTAFESARPPKHGASGRGEAHLDPLQDRLVVSRDPEQLATPGHRGAAVRGARSP